MDYLLYGGIIIGGIVLIRIYLIHLNFIWKSVKLYKTYKNAPFRNLFKTTDGQQVFTESLKETIEKKLAKKKKDDEYEEKYGKDYYQ